MNRLIERVMRIKQAVAFEVRRFLVLWRYQRPALSFTVWWRLVLKRVLDVAGAVALLALLSPVMALIALLVKRDSRGPAFFVQERLGRFGRPFCMYKFRTMRLDAEAQTGPVWAILVHDPRVTRLGRVLRSTHLDELPQLLNVVAGQMSLVGPRPERACFVGPLAHALPAYEQRLWVKPGMTGLAQVHYRYDQTLADVKRKLRFDLLYVKRMCLALDAKILAWTVLVVVTGRGLKSRCG